MNSAPVQKTIVKAFCRIGNWDRDSREDLEVQIYEADYGDGPHVFIEEFALTERHTYTGEVVNRGRRNLCQSGSADRVSYWMNHTTHLLAAALPSNA